MTITDRELEQHAKAIGRAIGYSLPEDLDGLIVVFTDEGPKTRVAAYSTLDQLKVPAMLRTIADQLES
jgi:hypothetical protein